MRDPDEQTELRERLLDSLDRAISPQSMSTRSFGLRELGEPASDLAHARYKLNCFSKAVTRHRLYLGERTDGGPDYVRRALERDEKALEIAQREFDEFSGKAAPIASTSRRGPTRPSPTPRASAPAPAPTRAPSDQLTLEQLRALAKVYGLRPAAGGDDEREKLLRSLWSEGVLQANGIESEAVKDLNLRRGERPPMSGQRRAICAVNLNLARRGLSDVLKGK